MRKIVCVEPGIIVLGNVLKNGEVSEKNREDVTMDCATAMMQHLSCFEEYQQTGITGYEWKEKDTGNKIQLLLVDTSLFEIVPRKK